MEDKPGSKPSRRRPLGVGFLFAGLGLLLLDSGAYWLALHHGGLLAWLMAVAGAALLLLAVLWGSGRI